MAKFCGFCGAPMEDSHRFCAKCGRSVQPEQTTRQTAYAQTPQYRYPPQYAASPVYQSYPNPNLPPYHMGPGGRMKWFKFIIYVQLFLSAASGVFSSYSLFTEAAYTRSMPMYPVEGFLQFYAVYLIVLAIVYLVFAVAAIWIRFRLSGFHRNGPALYIAFLSVNAFLSVSYSVCSVMALDLEIYSMALSNLFYTVMFVAVGAALITYVVMIVLTILYFKKRKSLFEN